MLATISTFEKNKLPHSSAMKRSAWRELGSPSLTRFPVFRKTRANNQPIPEGEGGRSHRTKDE